MRGNKTGVGEREREGETGEERREEEEVGKKN